MMQLITADFFGSSIGEIAEMHRLRYRVFKERLDGNVQVSGDMEIDAFDALQPLLLATACRRWAHPGLRALASFHRLHDASRYFSRSLGRSMRSR